MAPAPRIKPTRQNLCTYAVEPMARWLIDLAVSGKRKLTYGDVKGRLERNHGFSTIFPISLGYPAGEMMDRLLKADPNVPLLNVMLVRKDTKLPGSGAGCFLAEWANNPRLNARNARIRYRKLWATTCNDAEKDVRTYGKRKWAAVFKKAFRNPL